MMKLNDKTFHRALKSPSLLVVFTAAWAGPGNLIKPALANVAAAGLPVVLAEFDIDDNPVTPQTYGVRALPTLIMFRDGVPETVKAGAIPESAILEMINPPAVPEKKVRKAKAEK